MEPTCRAVVDVTFLRMDRPPRPAAPALPGECHLVCLGEPSVPFYRYLYDTVGGPYLWWLRRTLSDERLGVLLSDPRVSVHVLYLGDEPAGFFELDGRGAFDVNLNYFGLMPHAIGRGLGQAFLRQAVDAGWRRARRGLTVNTCTADHPRAMPTYLRGGFAPVRTVRENWDIPLRLGMTIAEHLRR